MNFSGRMKRRFMEERRKRWPKVPEKIPKERWPQEEAAELTVPPFEVWRSRDYLVLFYETDFPGVERMTVCRTVPDSSGRLADQIPWDALHLLKSQTGRGDREALEIYPRDGDVINVANMRHLWVFDRGLPWTWRDGRISEPEKDPRYCCGQAMIDVSSLDTRDRLSLLCGVCGNRRELDRAKWAPIGRTT